MGSQNENTLENLQIVVGEYGDQLGEVMSVLRKKLDRARFEGDENAAKVATQLYSQAAEIQYKRNQLAIDDILKSKEVQNLQNTLTEANKLLSDQLKKEEELQQDSGAIMEMFEKLEALFSNFMQFTTKQPPSEPTGKVN